MNLITKATMMPQSQPRMVGIPAAALGAVHTSLGQGRSVTEAAELARRVGFAIGPALVDAFEAELSNGGAGPAADLPTDEFWTRLSRFLSEAGWGDLTAREAHPGVASVTTANWTEAAGRSTAHPSCHLSTGLLAAVVSRVAGTDLAVLEATCRAAGAGECTFLVGGHAALGSVYARIRAGDNPTQAVAALG